MAHQTSDDLRRPALPTLLTWFSPAFPIGAFAYSHGLEAAVAEGRVQNADDVGAWVEALLVHGSGWNDLVLLAEALRAPDGPRLTELDELAAALCGSAERRIETTALGTAFAQAAEPWTGGAAPRTFPIAVAEAARAADLPAPDIVTAYAHGLCASLVSAAVRLVPLGQSQAVGILHDLEPVISEAARRAQASTLDDMGSATLLSDIAAMRHETLKTRLFRT